MKSTVSKRNELDSKNRTQVLADMKRLGLLKHMDALVEETSENDHHRHDITYSGTQIEMRYFHKNYGLYEDDYETYFFLPDERFNGYHQLENEEQRKFYRQLRTSLKHKELLCKVCMGRNRMERTLDLDPYYLGVWYVYCRPNTLKITTTFYKTHWVKNYYDELNSWDEGDGKIKYEIRKLGDDLYSIEVLDGDIIDEKLELHDLLNNRRLPNEFIDCPIFREAVLAGACVREQGGYKIHKVDKEIFNLLILMRLPCFIDDNNKFISIYEHRLLRSLYDHHNQVNYWRRKKKTATKQK